MRWVLALAALAMSGPLVAENPPLATAMVRATFVVRDIDRSVAFYREVFGYTVRYDGKIGSTPENRVLLALRPGEDARFVILDGERTFSGRDHAAVGIGLLAFPDVAKPRLRQPHGNRFASGQAMLALMTSDIAAVIERLRERGA
ncbi:MAG: VOC family protein, partial [Tsuneonella sp.]